MRQSEACTGTVPLLELLIGFELPFVGSLQCCNRHWFYRHHLADGFRLLLSSC